MCVILEKLAGKEVPFEHLLAGAHRNPDGYGVVVHDRGQLEVIQGLGKPEESAKKVAEFLAGAKDLNAYVHFRYKTVGEISVENTHPICVLRKAVDGIDLQFMHNGTISKLRGDSGKSDSMLFAEGIVGPLARRSAKYLGVDDITSDPLMYDILQRYAEGVSKFVLFDGNGGSMVVNRSGGAVQEYGWASNAYSIEPRNIPKEEKTATIHYPSRTSAWPRANNYTTSTDHEKLVDTLNKQSEGEINAITYDTSVRLTVKELTGFETSSFLRLDLEQIREMVGEEPDLSTILIADLLHEKYQLTYANSVLKAA